MSFIHEDAAPSITFVDSLELNVMFSISSLATSEFNLTVPYRVQRRRRVEVKDDGQHVECVLRGAGMCGQ